MIFLIFVKNQILVFVDVNIEKSNGTGPAIIAGALYEYYHISDSVIVSYIFLLHNYRTSKLGSQLADCIKEDAKLLSQEYCAKNTLKKFKKIVNEIARNEQEQEFLNTLIKKSRAEKAKHNLPITGFYAETLTAGIEDGIFPTDTRHKILRSFGMLQVDFEYIEPPYDDTEPVPDFVFIIMDYCTVTCQKSGKRYALKSNVLLFLIEYSCVYDSDFSISQIFATPFFAYMFDKLMAAGEGNKLWVSELPWTFKTHYKHEKDKNVARAYEMISKL